MKPLTQGLHTFGFFEKDPSYCVKRGMNVDCRRPVKLLGLASQVRENGGLSLCQGRLRELDIGSQVIEPVINWMQ